MRPKPDPEMVKHALELVAQGRTYAEVCAEIKEITGISYSQSAIMVWVKKSGTTKAEPVRAAPGLTAHLQTKREEAAKAPPAPELDVSDTLGTLRELVKGMLTASHEAKLSNPKLSAQLATAAGDLMNTVLRGEKTKAEDANVLRINRTEIADTWAQLLERVKAATERPLLCAHCSRQLSIDWGDAQAKVADAMKGKGQ